MFSLITYLPDFGVLKFFLLATQIKLEISFTKGFSFFESELKSSVDRIYKSPCFMVLFPKILK